MSGSWKRAAFAMVGAMVMLIVSAASAGTGPARGSDLTVRIDSASQKEILARGLEVRVSNGDAIKLYEGLGFVARGIRRGYYTDNREDALIMWKDPVRERASA